MTDEFIGDEIDNLTKEHVKSLITVGEMFEFSNKNLKQSSSIILKSKPSIHNK